MPREALVVPRRDEVKAAFPFVASETCGFNRVTQQKGFLTEQGNVNGHKSNLKVTVLRFARRTVELVGINISVESGPGLRTS